MHACLRVDLEWCKHRKYNSRTYHCHIGPIDLQPLRVFSCLTTNYKITGEHSSRATFDVIEAHGAARNQCTRPRVLVSILALHLCCTALCFGPASEHGALVVHDDRVVLDELLRVVEHGRGSVALRRDDGGRVTLHAVLTPRAHVHLQRHIQSPESWGVHRNNSVADRGTSAFE